MDVLKNKSYNDYNYTSRYTTAPYYYHTLDEKYVYGLLTNLKKTTPYVLHKVKEADTLELLAKNYYNNPTFYWVIGFYNDISDPDLTLFDYYDTLKIPTISAIEFGDER